MKPIQPGNTKWQRKFYKVIFESDTSAGRKFDIALLWAIIISVIAVFFESVGEVKTELDDFFIAIEWFFTILFTIEYVLRIYSVKHKISYALSFYGIVDLLAIIPTYLSLFFPGGRHLLVIRILRLLRVFRIFKLRHFLTQANVLQKALAASKEKIIVFLLTVFSIVVIMGTLMYVIEGPANGFTSIPKGIYWAIVTITTVGYGDLSPQTPFGQFIASILMITGYGIIAVPTGIITVELAEASRLKLSIRECPDCKKHGHDADAEYCKYCSAKLDELN